MSTGVKKVASDVRTEVSQHYAERDFTNTLNGVNAQIGKIGEEASKSATRASAKDDVPIWFPETNVSSEFLDETIHSTLNDMNNKSGQWSEVKTDSTFSIDDLVESATTRANQYRQDIASSDVYQRSRSTASRLTSSALSSIQNVADSLSKRLGDSGVNYQTEAATTPDKEVSSETEAILSGGSVQRQPVEAVDDYAHVDGLPSSVKAILDLTGDDDTSASEDYDEPECSLENALTLLQVRVKNEEPKRPAVLFLTESQYDSAYMDALGNQAVVLGLKTVKLSTSSHILSDGTTPLRRAYDRIMSIGASQDTDTKVVLIDARYGDDLEFADTVRQVTEVRRDVILVIVTDTDDFSQIADKALTIK